MVVVNTSQYNLSTLSEVASLVVVAGFLVPGCVVAAQMVSGNMAFWSARSGNGTVVAW